MNPGHHPSGSLYASARRPPGARSWSMTADGHLTGEQTPPGLVCASVTSCHRSQGVAWDWP